jgi:hypothetical protein
MDGLKKLKVFLIVNACALEHNPMLVHLLIDNKIEFKLQETKGEARVLIYENEIYSELEAKDIAKKIVVLAWLKSYRVPCHITIM